MIFSSKKTALNLLVNRNGFTCLFWATIQQLVVASSTLFIVRLMENITDSESSFSYFYFICFVSSLVIVYFPMALANYYAEKYNLNSYKSYIQLFDSINMGRRCISGYRFKDIYQSWLTNESLQVYSEATNLIHNAYSTLLNFSLNIIVIGLLIDIDLLKWYLLSIFLLLCSSIIFKRLIGKRSTLVQNNRTERASVLLKSWDNITLGNKKCHKIWESHLSLSIKNEISSVRKYFQTQYSILILTNLVALGCIAIGIINFIVSNSENYKVIAMMVVTLPRQIQILQGMFGFFGDILNFHGVLSRISGLNLALNIKGNYNKGFIKINELSFNHNGTVFTFNSYDDFYHYIKELKSGRITIRGKNGTGKTVLLCFLSEKLGFNLSTYIPSKHDLEFENLDIKHESDGRKMVLILNELIENAKELPKYLILDEWDANLDQENENILNNKIHTLSKDFVVIDVRHRL